MFSCRNTRLSYVNSIVIGVQQKQRDVDMMIDVNAAKTLLEKRATKFSGFEQDSNPQPWPFLTSAMLKGLQFDQGYGIWIRLSNLSTYYFGRQSMSF